MPAVHQNVCMSSFLCFCFVCFVDHVCSSPHRGSQTKKHCRMSLWSPASDLCKLKAIFWHAVNGSMSGWHWDRRFCISTKHWRTVGLLQIPLGTCHIQYSWLKIPLACVLRGVLPCVVKQMSLHWTLFHSYSIYFSTFTFEGLTSWFSAFPSPTPTPYTMLKPCGTSRSSTSALAHLSSWSVASWTCATLTWRQSIELGDHYQGTGN